MIKETLLLVLASFNLLTVFGQKTFNKVSSKTWFEENGFAGTTVVFIKADNGSLKAFKQINGSGLAVVATEIYDLKISGDTIFMLRTQRKQQKNQLENFTYIYSKTQGLLRDKKLLRAILDKPQIQLFTLDNQLVGEPINANEITQYDFDNNKVYVNGKPFIIEPKSKRK